MAFDLWSGLDTEMTRDELVSLMKSKFNAKIVSQYDKGKLTVFSRDKSNLNYQFPSPLIELGFLSPDSAFSQESYLNDMGNIRLYFYKNKLFAVALSPSADITGNVRKQYGNPTETIVEKDHSAVPRGYERGPRNHYIWKLKDKIIYNANTIVDRHVLDGLAAEEAKAAQEYKDKQAAEEAKKKAAAAELTF
jgi:hypothetical protein